MVRSGVPGERLFKENWEVVLHVAVYPGVENEWKQTGLVGS